MTFPIMKTEFFKIDGIIYLTTIHDDQMFVSKNHNEGYKKLGNFFIDQKIPLERQLIRYLNDCYIFFKEKGE